LALFVLAFKNCCVRADGAFPIGDIPPAYALAFGSIKMERQGFTKWLQIKKCSLSLQAKAWLFIWQKANVCQEILSLRWHDSLRYN
jgi:hypothetical protein